MSFWDLEELRSARRADRLVRIPPELDVPVTRRVMRLIDTPAFQRLTHISQLGLVSLVYPGAHHSRFEHSLGVYRLALLALEQLAGDSQFAASVSEIDARLLVLAALLHDIGHWPYCHPIEDMRLPQVERHEVHARHLITTGPIASLIERDWQVDPAEVADLIAPSPRYVGTPGRCLVRSVLNGPIDIDKLDYLQRDSLHAGVPYGRNFDQPRLVSSLCAGPDGRALAITSKGRTAAEMMVFARYVMFSEVYWHHAVRSATAMLQRLVYEDSRTETTATWLGRSDADMATALLESARPDPARLTLATGLFGRHRRLYKRLLGFNFVENPQAHEALARRSYGDLLACSQALAAELSRFSSRPIHTHEILIDAPPVKLEVQFQLSVRLASGEFRSLSSLSPVVRALATEQFDNYVKRVHVFIDPDRLADLQASPSQLASALEKAIEQVARRSGHSA